LIVSEQENGTYTLIAGERRLRASQIAGLNSVPVVIRQADEQELLELALIENIQREDLSPLEAAEAYKSLEENFNLTHEEISKRVGKNRASITNTMRLLKLPGDVQKALLEKKITEGHARVLLSLPTPQSQINAMNYIINNELNVRQTEEYIRNLVGEKRVKTDKPKSNLDPEMQEIENHLRQLVGTKVVLRPGKNGTGSINIHYYSNEDLDAIIKKLSGN
jgi:ParB family chromosome partitioning protein